MRGKGGGQAATVFVLNQAQDSPRTNGRAVRSSDDRTPSSGLAGATVTARARREVAHRNPGRREKQPDGRATSVRLGVLGERKWRGGRAKLLRPTRGFGRAAGPMARVSQETQQITKECGGNDSSERANRRTSAVIGRQRRRPRSHCTVAGRQLRVCAQ